MNFLTTFLIVAVALMPVAYGLSSKIWSKETTFQKLSSAGKTRVGLYGFSFEDCGGSSDPLHGNVSLSPNDPVTLPGKLTVSFNASFGVDVKSPLKVVLELKKKELIWIDLPCVDGIGSCTYDDFCKMLPPEPASGCPPPLKEKGLPCRCPVKAGKYSLPPAVFTIPTIPKVPEFLADGDYKANVKAYYGSKELGCINLTFSLKLNE
ncbi:ganglioside GM2 activator-like [Acanthaster planci]|uniref:Ganglioside GM2 activator-like n=1 Tax=Acanthaster planci TaxID=133434 RepID=A0A8B7Y108_ACAPL|nr:ganglioside GM2 activator-like [Acanthaster planci]